MQEIASAAPAEDTLRPRQKRIDARSGAESAGGPAQRAGWLADCHVHLHDSFDPAAFLDAASYNFQKFIGPPQKTGGEIGTLLLAEPRRQQGFARLLEGCGSGWTVQPTAERYSLLAKKGATRLAIIAGRQVVTRERLEVLLLGSNADLPDGEPIERTLEMAAATGGVAVLPWGVGKWAFGRGRVVERLLSRTSAGPFCVGDNGNRPRILGTPRLLRRARELGKIVLPGSDPLPLPGHVRRAGTCGVFLECMPDLERPARQMVSLLRGLESQPPIFWQPEPLLHFAVSQVLIRIRRKSGPRRPERAQG
jgi:hypothetical protein